MVLSMPVMKQMSLPSTTRHLHFVWHIPKHNVIIIGGDMNAQISKYGNHEFCFYKRNAEYPADFSREKKIAYLYSKLN